jgi:hypothetical protein
MKSVKSAGAKSAFHAIREPQPYNRDFINHVAGMVDTAARVVGLTPREIIDRVIDSVKEPEFQEGWEKRTIELELNPSDWKALEEIARATNGTPLDLSVPIMEAVTSRFTAKELATMVTGGSIPGVWGIQRNMESQGEEARERMARKGAQ